MSAPIGDDDTTDSELSKYAPKWSREQPAKPGTERPPYVSTLAPTVPSSTEVHQNRRTRSEFALWPEPIPEPPVRRAEEVFALIGRIALVGVFAALVALLVIFAKPLWEGVAPLKSKPSDQLTANNAPASSSLVPATGIAAAPGAVPSTSAQAQQAPPPPAQGQQASLSPSSNPLGQESSVKSAV